MKTVQYIAGFITIVMALHSCKPLQMAQPDNRFMPSAFGSFTGDTASSGTVNWKEFFADKNLNSLIYTALANNWDLKAATQRIQAARASVVMGKGALLPTVAGAAAAGINRYGVYTMDGAGNKNTPIHDGKDIPEHLPDYFIGLQTSWEVDLWGRLKNRKKAAVARFLSSIEGRNLVRTGLITEIATAYYELKALDQTEKILDENMAIREKAYNVVKVQKEADAANELAVKQFEAQWLNVQAALLQVRQQIVETENRISMLMGKFPGRVDRDTAFFQAALPKQMQIGVPTALLQNRPDIRQAELELQAARADVQAARAAFYPSLNITGSLGFQAFKAGLLFSTPESVAYGLMGSLTAPLINRTAIKAEFSRASATQLELMFNYQKSIVNGYTEVYNQLLRARTLQEVLEVKEKEATALTQSIDISEKLFKTGRASYLEVLFAQQNALEVRLQLVETKRDQLLTIIDTYKALGGGWR